MKTPKQNWLIQIMDSEGEFLTMATAEYEGDAYGIAQALSDQSKGTRPYRAISNDQDMRVAYLTGEIE